MPSLPVGWTVVASVLAAVQLAAAARFLLRSRRASPPLPRPAPSVTVVVAFKGDSPALETGVASLLAQDYPGELEWRFVLEREDDAAAPVLRAAAAKEPRAQVLVSGASPTRSSVKALNLAAGAASSNSDILLFADAGLSVAPDWAARLVAALGEPGATVATAVEFDDPNGGVAALLRLAWAAYGLPWFEPMTLAAGHALAIRRRDFDGLAVDALWRSSISEDLALSARVRERGGRCVLVAAAAPVSRREAGVAETLERLDRWTTLFRFYQPRVWVLGLAATAVKLGALIQAFQAPVCWPLAGVVLGGDALAVALVLLGIGRGGFAAVLISPVLILVHAGNYAASLFYREIVWSDWTYRLDRPTAEPGPEPAFVLRARRLAKLAAAVLGGSALGLAYLPGAWGALTWVALVPLLWAASDEEPSGAFVWGTIYGTAAYLHGAYWCYDFLRRFLGAGPPEAFAWFAGICLLHGLRWGACAALTATARSPAARTALFALGAIAAEPFLPTLFPAPFATTQVFHLPTVQLMETWGEAGPAVLVVAVNAALYLLLRAPRRDSIAFAGVVAAAALANEFHGRRRIVEVAAEADARPAVRVGLVQGGVRPDAPASPNRFAQDLPLYVPLTREAAAGADLVVWPESAYAAVLDYDLDAPAGALADGLPLADAVRRDTGAPAPLLLNAIGRAADGRERNVSVLTDAKGNAVGFTEKSILAPFGEYMPAGFSWLSRVSPLTATLSPGTGARVLPLGEARLGVLICYESFISGPAERLVGLGADVLVAQVNDAWFDGSAEPEEHLRLSVLRAIENRRALIHAANTGVSAAVAPTGRVVARVEAGRAGNAVYAAPRMSAPARGPRNARLVFGLAAILLAVGTVRALREVRS